MKRSTLGDIESDRRFHLGRLISHTQEMYSMLNDAMNALRCAGVSDTRSAMTTASEIEKLLNRIDGKENDYD